MAEGVQTPITGLNESSYEPSGVPLIKEETRFLTLGYVYVVLQIVLPYYHLLRDFSVNHALSGVYTFYLYSRFVGFLVYTFGIQQVCYCSEHDLPEGAHTVGGELNHHVLSVDVHYQTRQEISLRVNKPKSVAVYVESLPVVVGGYDPLPYQIRSDGLALVKGEYANGYANVRVYVPVS